MKKLLFTLFLLSSLTGFGQTKVTGYFDGKIGLSFHLSKKIQTEIRVNDNLGINFDSSLHIQYQFVTKDKWNLNLGFGVNTQPFTNTFVETIFFPLAIEIIPFKESTNFALVIESAYHYMDDNFSEGIRNSIGFRYIFN